MRFLHGFEPVRYDMDPADLRNAYRTAGKPLARVHVEDPVGGGIASASRLSSATPRPGVTVTATEPAEAVLARLERAPRPSSMADAAFLRNLRMLCREAIEVLGTDAAILHAVHGTRADIHVEIGRHA